MSEQAFHEKDSILDGFTFEELITTAQANVDFGAIKARYGEESNLFRAKCKIHITIEFSRLLEAKLKDARHLFHVNRDAIIDKCL